MAEHEENTGGEVGRGVIQDPELKQEDAEMYALRAILGQLEKADDPKKVKELIELVAGMVDKRRSFQQEMQVYQQEMQGQRLETQLQDDRQRDERRDERRLVLFKLIFGLVAFVGGLYLATSGHSDVGFFLMGGAVALIAETAYNR